MINVRAQMPQWARDLFKPSRYKVFYGGRGAGRSWSFARALLIMGSQKRLRILCCREFQKSLDDSVHKLLSDQIALMKLPGWEIKKAFIVHKTTKTTFIFEGLRYNTNRIKSMEGIDICWVEEAESVADDSWQALIPTIRKDGSEIWMSFNPDLEEDPTYQRFVVNKPPNCIAVKVGWEDNPWFPEELRIEKDYLYSVDPEAADHVWGGIPWKRSQSQILGGKWKVDAFEPQKKHPLWKGPFYGLDFGFSEDPTALTESWIEYLPGKVRRNANATLYVRRESWKIGLDLHKMRTTWHPVFTPNLSRCIVRADDSRPESISYLKQHGFQRIRGAKKWPGSVEDGIAYLRQFREIVIHPSCKHTREEFKLYSYKVDPKTREVLRQIVDKHNHTVDAIRYSLQPFIRARRKRSSYAGTTYSAA